ncbi:MAG: hypothetical protein EBR40_08275, partial [Proteobacteria bacterium]|nr:hypothetical protein [Pseudomonadota bacterium]
MDSPNWHAGTDGREPGPILTFSLPRRSPIRVPDHSLRAAGLRAGTGAVPRAPHPPGVSSSGRPGARHRHRRTGIPPSGLPGRRRGGPPPGPGSVATASP